MFLADCGYEVETALDGLECLDKLRQMIPDVLVLDFGLRWGGGDGILAWLRKERAWSEFPVILTTNTLQTLDFAKDFGRPVTAILLRPFAPESLLENLRTCLDPDRHDAAYIWHRAASKTELFVG
jgi:CheY-like chemotaxis protein